MRLWDVESSREIARFPVRGRRQLGRRPLPRRPAASVHDSKVDLWDVSTAKRISSLEGHTEQVKGVAFFTDGRTALTCSQDRTVRVVEALLSVGGEDSKGPIALAFPRSPDP